MKRSILFVAMLALCGCDLVGGGDSDCTGEAAQVVTHRADVIDVTFDAAAISQALVSLRLFLRGETHDYTVRRLTRVQIYGAGTIEASSDATHETLVLRPAGDEVVMVVGELANGAYFEWPFTRRDAVELRMRKVAPVVVASVAGRFESQEGECWPSPDLTLVIADGAIVARREGR